MRFIYIIVCGFAFGLQAADSPAPVMDGAWSIESGLQSPNPVPFVSRVTREQVARTPEWKQDSEFPPLSPRKAEDAARVMLHRVVGERHWTQPEIFLKPFDVTPDAGGNRREVRWIYVLHFGLLGEADNESGAFNIIVLMDGTAIEPRPAPEKPPAPNHTRIDGESAVG